MLKTNREKFLFQTGAIRSICELIDENPAKFLFLFQTGAIRRLSIEDIAEIIEPFLFQTGAIRRKPSKPH